jgi:NADH-ubiquinone oxidoreductase chain 5
MGIPLIVLSFGSIFLGYLSRDMIVGIGTDFWQHSIFVLPQNNLLIESEFIPVYIKLIPTVFSFSGAILAIVLNHFYVKFLYNASLSNVGLTLYAFLNKKWYFDKLYNEYLNKPIMSFGYFISFKSLDKGLVEILGPYGIVSSFNPFIKVISKFQTGYIYHYAFLMLIGTVLLLTIINLWLIIQTYIFIDNRLLFIYVTLILFFITSLNKKKVL